MSEITAAAKEECPFFDYSAKYWVDHVNSAPTMKTYWLQKAHSLCSQETYPAWVFVNSAKILNQWHCLSSSHLRLVEQSSNCAIRLGLVEVVKMLLNEGEDLVTADAIEDATKNEQCGQELVSLF